MRRFEQLRTRSGNLSIFVFSDHLDSMAAEVRRAPKTRWTSETPEQIARAELLNRAERRRQYAMLLEDQAWVAAASPNDLLYARKQASMALPGEVPQREIAESQLSESAKSVLHNFI
jgi:hypothetical protein